MSKIILGDGGMGTELRERGIEVPSHIDSVWSALALEDNPEEILQIHRDFINAGSDYITINNYAVTQPILSRVNNVHRFKDLTETSIRLAKKSIPTSNNHKALVAASFPPLETSYRPDLVLSKKDLIYKYSELAELVKNEVDFIICETMTTKEEGRIALQIAKQTDLPVWLAWTLHGNRINKIPGGESLKEATDYCIDLDPEAVLINCCGANLVTEGIKELSKYKGLTIGGYANSEVVNNFSSSGGLIKNAEEIQSRNSKSINEDMYSNEVLKWIEEGASIVGGCCRTRPSHIRLIKQKIN